MDHTQVTEADEPRPDPQRLASPAPTDPAGVRVRPAVAAVHGLWTGALAGAAVAGLLGALLGPAQDLGERLATMVVVSAWLGLAWVPVTALWGCAAGLAGGLAARCADRLTGGGQAGPVLVASVAGAVVGGGGTLVVDVASTLVSTASTAAGAAVGGLAVALERRGARRPAQPGRPRHRGVLSAATAVLAVAAWSWIGWVSLRAEPWDWGETCAPLLGRPSDEISFAHGGFPLQGWCLGGTSDVVPTQPVWHAVLATVLLTAAVVAAAALVASRLGAWASPAGRAVAAGLLTVVLGAGVAWAWATATAGPSDEDWQELAGRRASAAAAEAARSRAPSGGWALDPAPAPAPAPSAPVVSAADARADLEVLRVAAQDAGGPDLLWPQELAVVAAACTSDDGAAGVRLSLTGRFTTRDLGTAADDVDFLSITQANEEVAARIADAWSRHGLGAPEPLHGEWWQGPAADGRAGVQTAHVGFDEGVGMVRVDAVCATATP